MSYLSNSNLGGLREEGTFRGLESGMIIASSADVTASDSGYVFTRSGDLVEISLLRSEFIRMIETGRGFSF